MGKIYEALQYSLRKQPESGKKAIVPAVQKEAAPRGIEPDLEEEMVRLFQGLDPCMSSPKKRLLQFIGSRDGEGVSTMARQFATVAARRFGKRVLLLDADQRNSDQTRFYRITASGWSDSLMKGEPVVEVIKQVSDFTLFVGGISKNPSSIAQLFSSPRIEVCLEQLKQLFDIIVIDSPPATVSADGLTICSKVDGVILAVEAEKVRWPVAQNTKENILRNGGKILGIVFNKRKHYIPESVYQRL